MISIVVKLLDRFGLVLAHAVANAVYFLRLLAPSHTQGTAADELYSLKRTLDEQIWDSLKGGCGNTEILWRTVKSAGKAFTVIGPLWGGWADDRSDTSPGMVYRAFRILRAYGEWRLLTGLVAIQFLAHSELSQAIVAGDFALIALVGLDSVTLVVVAGRLLARYRSLSQPRIREKAVLVALSLLSAIQIPVLVLMAIVFDRQTVIAQSFLVLYMHWSAPSFVAFITQRRPNLPTV